MIAALNTGMRQGELLNLKWADVNFVRKNITITTSKNNERRDIPMSGYLSETLAAIKAGSKGIHVFVDSSGKPFSRFGFLRTRFDKAVNTAGIEDFHFHDLRHTFASHLVMGGYDILTVKELLGHKSLEMTLRYAHLSSDHKRLAVESVISSKFGTIMAQTDKAQLPIADGLASKYVIKST